MNRITGNLHGFFEKCNFKEAHCRRSREGLTMFKKHVWGSTMLLLLIAAQAVAAAGDPVSLKLNWKPGETYRYRCDQDVSTSSGGQTMQMQFSINVSLKVLGTGGTSSPTPPPEGPTQMTSQAQSFALGGRTTDIELRYGDMTTTMRLSGQTLTFHVDQKVVKGTLNGSPLPASKMAELRKEIKPLQELLGAVIRIQITDSGRITSVAGLEKLDAATQKDLAMDLLESMLLPDRPLKVGEHYLEKKNVARFASRNAGSNGSGLNNPTVELVRTLKSVRKMKDGTSVAEFSAPLQKKFEDFPLDDKGKTGTAEANLVFKSHIDVDKGTILKETAEGTILVTPRGSGTMTLKTKATMSLVEPKKYQALAANF